MDLFHQQKPNTCQLVAIQTVWSYFSKEIPSAKHLSRELPKHSYGNSMVEIGIYWQKQGFHTELISNQAVLNNNASWQKDLQSYLDAGGHWSDRNVVMSDLEEAFPVIINVNAQQIKKRVNDKRDKIPHYVVVLFEEKLLNIYDSYSFTTPQIITFEQLLEASEDINFHYDRGLWLIIRDKN